VLTRVQSNEVKRWHPSTYGRGRLLLYHRSDEGCHYRQWLAVYKVPHLFEIRTNLPKTLAGKVLRRKLVEEDQIEQDDKIS